MALTLADKKAIVADVNQIASGATAAVLAYYHGLSVSDMTELRAKARETNVDVRVVRNTLAKRAFEGTELECLKDVLAGPVLLAFSNEEPSGAARLIRDFVKEHEALEVKALALSGQLLDAKSLADVAKLPTYDEAIAKLMSVMQAPIAKFVRTLAEPHTKMVRTFAAVRDQKKAS